MFMISLILFQMLIGIFTSLYIDFNLYLFGIKMYFMFHLQLYCKYQDAEHEARAC